MDLGAWSKSTCLCWLRCIWGCTEFVWAVAHNRPLQRETAASVWTCRDNTGSQLVLWGRLMLCNWFSLCGRHVSEDRVPYSLEGPSRSWSLWAGGSLWEAGVMSLCPYCLVLLSAAEPLSSTSLHLWPLWWSPWCGWSLLLWSASVLWWARSLSGISCCRDMDPVALINRVDVCVWSSSRRIIRF